MYLLETFSAYVLLYMYASIYRCTFVTMNLLTYIRQKQKNLVYFHTFITFTCIEEMLFKEALTALEVKHTEDFQLF